ncbi:MAG: hypothetical protein K2P99_02360, partial [Burkholderiales bacterium]|nr:hypothetical protein [Burkholderiales bacterium]
MVRCLRSYWLFGLFLLLAIVIGEFQLNQKLFFVINGFHGILPDQIWLGINYICDAKHFILSASLLIATLLFGRKNTIRVLILIIVYYAVFSSLKKIFGEARPFVVLPQGSFYWLNQAEQSVGR